MNKCAVQLTRHVLRTPDAVSRVIGARACAPAGAPVRKDTREQLHKETPKRKCEEQLESVNGVLAFCCHCFRRVPELKIALPLNLLQLLRRLSIGRSI